MGCFFFKMNNEKKKGKEKKREKNGIKTCRNHPHQAMEAQVKDRGSTLKRANKWSLFD